MGDGRWDHDRYWNSPVAATWHVHGDGCKYGRREGIEKRVRDEYCVSDDTLSGCKVRDVTLL